MKTIGIACDHAGYQLKEFLKTKLCEKYRLVDFGTDSENSMDYPDVAHPLAEAVVTGKLSWGIAICGSGNGINMTLNKHAGIRSALCWNTELASLARKHNDANILALPARFITNALALEMAEVFANTDFEGGRHQNRIRKINLS
ncbi:MAG: RpiB/LacA/LacB family sugar-phosphate isomerase [Bacteroidota bacterium]|jgi:ribose 5-phosphate isomerase B